MKTFNIKFKAFSESEADDMQTEANTLIEASFNFRSVFPKGEMIQIEPIENEPLPDNVTRMDLSNVKRMPMNELPCKVIYVDFKAKKVVHTIEEI